MLRWKCLAFLLFSVGVRSEDCQVASSVHTALSILQVDPPDIFNTNQDDLRLSLEQELVTIYSQVNLSTLADDDLFDLTSMVVMVNLDRLRVVDQNVQWLNESPAVLRIGFERLAMLKESDDRQKYLSAFIGEMKTREVLLLSCHNRGWTVDGRTVDDFPDGCYVGTEFSIGFNNISNPYQCIAECRSKSYKFSTFNSSEACFCSSLQTELGGFSENDVECSTGSMVYKTGKGVPVKVFLDPQDPLRMFDPQGFGEPAIEDNGLLGLEQVHVLDSSAPYHFIAVHRNSLVLYEVDVENGVQRYKYLDHLRWDCGPDLIDSQCLQGLGNEEEDTFQPPSKSNRIMNAVFSYQVVPLYVTLNHTMELNETLQYSEEAFTERSITAGDPMRFAGGRFIHHVFLFHGDHNPGIPKGHVKITAVRLSEGKIIQLLEAPNESSNFGQFLKGSMHRYAVATTKRQVGRRSFVFVGSHLDADPHLGGVNLFELVEEEISITNYASYGRIKMEAKDFQASHKVRALEFIQTIYPLLIVLDSHPDISGSSRLSVFRIKELTSMVKLCDLVVSETHYYTSIDFIRTKNSKYLLLKSKLQGVYVEISSTGALSNKTTPFELLMDQTSVFNFGRLENNVLVPALSSRTTESFVLYDIENKPVEKLDIDLSDRNLTAMVCFPCHESGLCIGSGTSNSVPVIDMFKFLPYSQLKVDNTVEVLTDWKAARSRIDAMFQNLEAKYHTQQEMKTKYLMHSGSIVNGNWNITRLNVSTLILPADSMTASKVEIIQVNSTGHHSRATYEDTSNVTRVLGISLDEAERRQQFVVDKTAELRAYHDRFAVRVNETNAQTITGAHVDVLFSPVIHSTDYNLGITEVHHKNLTKNLDSVITNTFNKTRPVSLLDTKTFKAKVEISDLTTTRLAGASQVVNPTNCLLNTGDQNIQISQSFSEIAVENLSVPDNINLIGENMKSVSAADLVPHTNLPGHFRFADTVLAPGVKSSQTVNQVNITTENVENIVVKDQENIINGTLNIIVSTSFKGEGILSINGTVSGHNLKDLTDHVIPINCEGECIDLVDAGNKTFTGDVNVGGLLVETVNLVQFSDYVTKLELSQESVLIKGETTVNGKITADRLKAPAFDGVELEKLVTTNDDQELESEGSFVYNKEVTFKAINTSGQYPFAKVDEKDMFKFFRSDLHAVKDGKPWIINNTVPETVKFEQLNIPTEAKASFNSLVNGMDVNKTLERVVLDVDDVTHVAGEKLVVPDIQLEGVIASSIIDENGKEVKMEELVNTKTTSIIKGHNRFSQEVTFEEIFTLGDAKINELSLSKLHDCFVDTTSESGEPIHVYNPIKFDSLSIPRLLLERNPDFTKCLIVPTNISLESAAQFIGFNAGNLNNLQTELITFMKEEYNVDIPNDSSVEDIAINISYSQILKNNSEMPTFSLDEKRTHVKRLLHDFYGLSISFLDLRSDLEILAYSCRNPLVNNLDVSTDVAMWNEENHFGTRDTPHLQILKGGLEAEQVGVEDSVLVNNRQTVFSADISEMNEQRVSLSRKNQLMNGLFNFSKLAMAPGGRFSGELFIETSDGFISTLSFPHKFLDRSSSDTQVFTSSGVKLTNFQADTILTNSLQVNGETVDIVKVDEESFDLDKPIALEQLTLANDSTISGPVSLGGLIDDVDLKVLTSDIVVHGQDMRISEDRKVTGSDSDSISLSGRKSFKKVVEAENMLSKVNNVTGEIMPNTVFMPCIQGQPQTGLLLSSQGGGEERVLVVNSLEDCKDECRHDGCYGLSYIESSRSCHIFISYNALDTSRTDSISILYDCWVQLKSSSSHGYLAVNRTTGNLIISKVADTWFFRGSKLLHKPTGKFVYSGQDVLTIRPQNPNQLPETFTYTSTVDFQIRADSLNKFLVDESSQLVLAQSGDSAWTAVMGGVSMSHIEDGEILPLVLTQSGNEEVTGKIEVLKKLDMRDSQFVASNIGPVSFTEVSSRYSWSQDTHQIFENFTVTGNGNRVENLFQDEESQFLQDDVILLNRTDNIHLKGTTTFGSMKVTTSDLSASGLVSGFNLVQINNTIARKDVQTVQVFTELNTFHKENERCVQITDGLASAVDMVLNKTSIQGGVDLVNLVNSVIYTNSDDAVHVKGAVNFNQIVVNGGNLSLAAVKLNDEIIQIPTHLILRTSSEMNLADRNISVITATQNLEITGKLFESPGDAFLCVLYKNGDQNISTDFTFTGRLETSKNLLVEGFINQTIIPESSLVFIDSESAIAGKLHFNSLFVQEVGISSVVNGRDFDDFVRNIFISTHNNTVSEVWTFNSDVVFSESIMGDSTEGLINNQRSSDIAVVSDVYDKADAVKLSAQTEAYVLCEFVSDLQNTYLTLQHVVKYTPKASQRFDGSRLSSVNMVVGAGHLYLLAIDGERSLNIYSVKQNLLALSFNIQVGEPSLSYKVDHIVDLEPDHENEFKYVVFLSCSEQSDGVHMYLFNGTSDNINIKHIGLLESTASVVVADSDVVVLSLVFNSTENQNFTRLEKISKSDLVACQLDCSDVGRSVLWTDLHPLPERVSPARLSILHRSSGVMVVAFVFNIFGQDAVRILAFKHGFTSGHPFADMIDTEPCDSYALLDVKSKLFIVSSGSSISMKEILLDVNEFRSISLNLEDVDTTYSQVRTISEFGKQDAISVIENGQTLRMFSYAGDEGLKKGKALTFQHSVHSCDGLSYISSDQTRYLEAVVGGPHITVLEGFLKNPFSEIKFGCPFPEIPVPVLDP